MTPKKIAYLSCAYIALGLGFAGIFLPLLPTTPFVLLAAFCFSRSSPRLHAWLRAHPLFGHLLADWQDYGVIPLRAKIVTTALLTASLSYPILFKPLPIGLKIVAALVGVSVLTFVLSRPSRRADQRRVDQR